MLDQPQELVTAQRGPANLRNLRRTEQQEFLNIIILLRVNILSTIHRITFFMPSTLLTS